MLFKKQICQKCGQEYDELVDNCPNCKEENPLNLDLRNKYPMVYLSFYRQIGLFVLGLFGFAVFNILFALLFNSIYKENQALGSMLINMCSYILFLIFVIAIIFPYFASILKRLQGYRPYVFGVIGGVILTGGSTLISVIISLIYPSIGQGGNQSGIIALTNAYPVFSMLIFGIVGPICEEFAYRVGLFSFLRRINRWVAYIATALIFALIHFDYTSSDLLSEFLLMFNYIWAGVAFSVIYEFGGVGASMTAHILNNVFSLILITIGVSV